jgi:hypothetical protein
MRVVPTFDPGKHSHLRFRLRLEATTAEQLTLKRGEEALRHRVVVGITDRAHRRHDVRLLAALAERVARVLTAAIRVMDHVLRTTLDECHLQRSKDQLGFQVRLHRPTHDPSRVHVEDHGQIQKSGPGRDVRDIGHPEPIRAVRVEAPITRSLARSARGSLVVVTTNLRRVAPRSPAARIKRATRLRPTRML